MFFPTLLLVGPAPVNVRKIPTRKAVRSCHVGSLKGEMEEEAVWDVIVGSCVAE